MYLKRILGTEPALITGAVQAILAVLVAIGLFGLDEAGAGVLMLVVSAVTGALATWTTFDSRLTAVVEVVKAVLVALTFFQVGDLSLSPEQQATIVTAVTALGTVFIRANTVPIPTPLSAPTLAAVAQPGEIVGGPLTEVLEDGEYWGSDEEDPFIPDEEDPSATVAAEEGAVER